MKRLERHATIEKTLADFKGLKYVAGIKSCQKRKYTTSMIDNNGQEQTERQHIANNFTDFYADLYQTRQHGSLSSLIDDGSRIPLFTPDELRKELCNLIIILNVTANARLGIQTVFCGATAVTQHCQSHPQIG